MPNANRPRDRHHRPGATTIAKAYRDRLLAEPRPVPTPDLCLVTIATDEETGRATICQEIRPCPRHEIPF